MRISRQLIGKVVEIQWMDPQFTRVELNDITVGRKCLATWREYGVIRDVTDGVVQIVHSAASSAGTDPTETNEVAYTPVPEALIEKLTVFEPASTKEGDA